MIPPHSIEAERSILGAMLLDRDAAAIVVNWLSASDMYRAEHQAIMEACTSLFLAGRTIDLITVAKALMEAGKDRIAPASYLAELAEDIPFHSQLEAHCTVVKDLSRARGVISLARNIMDMAYQGKAISWIVDDFGKGFFDILADRVRGSRSMEEIIPEVVEQIIETSKHGVQQGISTGFVDLDRRWYGLNPADLVIIAARPSMGKTCLAVNIGCNVAAKGKTVLMFSLEMSDRKLVERIISASSKVPSDRMRMGTVTDDLMERIIAAGNGLKKMKFHIDHTGGLSITELQARAKIFSLKNSVDLIIVDYMQLMSAKAQSREQEVSAICRGLKSIAKELNVPVIALSQLNRSVESRPDKRPLMSDLRESGAIEQDADIISFIYRDDYYNDKPDNPARGVPEIITRKQRSGPVGVDRLLFRPEINQFFNFDAARQH